MGAEAVDVMPKVAIKPLPPKYEVLLLNDDFTPITFVIDVLQDYFSKDAQAAEVIALHIHRSGKGLCGIYTKDVAMTKVEMVIGRARKEGHPLNCVMGEI